MLLAFIISFLIKVILYIFLGDQIFCCRKCGNVYKCSTSLKRHLRYYCGRIEKPIITGYWVSPKGYICQSCSRSYKNFSSIKRHLKYECGKMPNITCPVGECGYKAKLRCRMLQHVRIVHNLE